jgi:hypothetical protein
MDLGKKAMRMRIELIWTLGLTISVKLKGQLISGFIKNCASLRQTVFGAFVTKSCKNTFACLSVRLSACSNSRTAKRIFTKFDTWEFAKNLSTYYSVT